MASVFVLLEAFNRKEAAALGFFSLCNSLFCFLGPLWEGAPPAGGGGENCTAIRNISGYGKVLSLRPFGAPPSQREVFRHAVPSPTGKPNQTKTPRCKPQRGVKCYLCDFTWMRRRNSWRRKRNRGAPRPKCGQRTESTGQRRGGSGGKHRP